MWYIDQQHLIEQRDQDMELTFLGTSSGTPTKTRNLSGCILSLLDHKQWFMVDCGEGSQRQLLHCRHSMTHCAAILITHMHGDHWYGLPGLLCTASMAGRQQPLTIIAPVELESVLAHIFTSSQTVLAFELKFVDVAAKPEVYRTPQLAISRLPLSHRVPSYAYRFAETHGQRHLNAAELRKLNIPRGPVWGQLKRGETVTLADGRSLDGNQFLSP